MTPTINHVGLTVGDLDAAIAFLERFGFAVQSRGGRPPGLAEALTGVAGAEVEIAFLTGAAVLVELLHYRAPRHAGPLPSPAHPGAAHLAVEVASIDAALRAGRAAGASSLGQVVVIPAGPNAGNRVAYVQHSCGVALELIEPAKKALTN